MCSGYFSSRIAKEESILWNKDTSVYKLDSFNNRLLSIIEPELPFIETFYLAGGEPMLIPEHYDLLERLIKLGITDKEIKYNTNLSVLSFKDKNIIDLWQKFNNIQLGISLDAYGPRAEYQRHGTIWNNITSNIKLVQSKSPHVNIKITSVLTVFNSLHLQDLQTLLIKEFNIKPSDITFNMSIGPDISDISILSNSLRTEFIKKTNKHIRYLKSMKGAQNLCNLWQNAVNYIIDNNTNFLVPKFKKVNQLLDTHRNESFVSVYPELSELYK